MEAQQYTERLTHFFLLGHDIPRSFYDVGGTSYSGARQELIQYYQAIRWIRDRLKRVGDRIFAWWLAREIAAGRVTLPDGYTVETLPRDWIAPGLPWIDPLKEIAAHAKALEMGITTRSRIARELYGLDYAELVRERAREDRMMKKYGVAPALEKSDATEPSDGARGPGKAPAARRTWRHRVAGWFGRAPVSAVPSVSPVGKAVA